MKWVIAGGTGFLGGAIVDALVDDDHEVVVLSRADRASGRARLSYARWTPGDSDGWTRTLEGADVVLNLAGAGVMDERWSDARLELIRSSRVTATTAIASAVAKMEPKPRVLLSASAIGLYGMRMDDEVLAEQAPAGSDVLASICRDWEQAADRAREAGVRVGHPRIGIVLGRSGGALARMLPAFRAWVGGPIGSGRQWFSWVHLADVVGSILFAAGEANLSGPFNVAAPESVRMGEFASTLGSVLGRPSVMRVPALALRAMLGPGAQALLTGQRVAPQVLTGAGYGFKFSRLRAALEDLLH